MSVRPFMQLYVSDYLGDTRELSCEQHGAYLLLLMTMWNAGGSLPDDDTKLARVCCLSVKKWKAMRIAIGGYFDIEDGVWTNERLTKELQKSESQRELRASAGARGGAANALKYKNTGVANAVAGLKHARALPKPYKKEGNFDFKGKEESRVTLDRIRDERMFEACEAIEGKVKPFLQRFAFQAETVSKAKSEMESVK